MPHNKMNNKIFVIVAIILNYIKYSYMIIIIDIHYILWYNIFKRQMNKLNFEETE